MTMNLMSWKYLLYQDAFCPKLSDDVHGTYSRELDDTPGIELIDYDPAEQHNFHYFVSEVYTVEAGLSRDHFVAVLHAQSVLARRYFYSGFHRLEPYRSLHENDSSPAVTERLADRLPCLPTGTAVGIGQIEATCGIIRLAVKKGRQDPQVA